MAQLDGDHWGMLSYKYNVDNNRTTEEAGSFEPKQRPTACSLMAVKLVAKQKQRLMPLGAPAATCSEQNLHKG